MKLFRMYCAAVFAVTAVSLASHAAPAPGTPANAGVMVHEAWARASAGAATTGGAYVTLMGGSQPDQLIGASTPVATTAQVHQTIDDHGVMKMREVPSVPIPAGGMVTFAPGGGHIMLMGLKHPLKAGETFPLTLTFAHAPPMTVDVHVKALGSGGAGMGAHDHMKMQ